MFKGKFIDIVSKDDGFLRGPFGSALKKSLFVPKGNDTYKVYEQSVVLEQDESLGRYYISNEYFNEKMHRFETCEGDFLVSCSGVNYGAIYRLPAGSERGVINQALLRIRLNNEIVDNDYFLYYFRTYIVKVITGGTGDSTIPNFPPMDYVKNIDIVLPDLDVQKRIGTFLRLLNDKILNNNKINQELECLARTIFEYWFLQFDFPNVEGKPYKSSGGKMVWNEVLNQEIPEGWKNENISSIISNSKNGDWGSDEIESDDDIKVNCFRGADFPCITREYKVTAPIRFIKSRNVDRLLEDGDLVTEISGGSPTQSTGRIGYINSEFLKRFDNVMDCSNFCKAFSVADNCYQYWLYQMWNKLYESGAMFNFESKTTGIKNFMYDEFVNSVNIAFPEIALLKAYQHICKSYYDKIQKNLKENQVLSEIMDSLMPMLMNGQIGFVEV